MKSRGINKDIFSHMSWLLPITELKPDFFTKKIGELLSSETEVRKKFGEVIPEVKKRAFSAADYLKEALSL